MAEISIILPTRNRAGFLKNALISIARVAGCLHLEEIEIIVVDNGSSDNTKQICAEVGQSFPGQNLRYFYDEVPGLLTGRHRGAREGTGEILAYLDDDVLLESSWLSALREAFSDPEVALVGGPSRPAFEREPPLWLDEFWSEFEEGRQCSWLSLIDCGNIIKPADPQYLWGLNFAIRRRAFEDCGGFHPDCIPQPLQRYQGDGETGLAIKIKDAGLKCLYHPRAAVQHVIPVSRLTPTAFEQRAFYQGVCDSYTQIRRDGRVPDARERSWKDVLRPIKWKLEREAIVRRPTAEGVHRLTVRAYLAGQQFHQHEVRNDPKLLEWVLRPDYFDYRLPEGWEGYLPESTHDPGEK